jgi:hypothetical protein
MRLFAVAAIIAASLGQIRAGETGPIPVEVQLKSGQSFIGSLVRDDERSVTIRCVRRSKSGVVTASVTYFRDDIGSITDLDQDYRQRAGKASPDADQQLALAQWCIDHGLDDRAARHAMAAAAAEPANTQATAMLQKAGYVQLRGRWVDADAYLAEHGLVRWRDRIITVADKEQLAPVQAKVAAAADVVQAKQAALDRLTGLIAIDERSLEANKKRQEALDAELTAQAAKLTQAQKQVADLTKKLDAATKAAAKKQSKTRGRGGNQYGAKPDADAEKQAQADLADAQAQEAQLQEKQRADQAEKTELVSHEKALNQELDSYRAQSVMTTADLAAAKQAVTTAEAELAKFAGYIKNADPF